MSSKRKKLLLKELIAKKNNHKVECATSDTVRSGCAGEDQEMEDATGKIEDADITDSELQDVTEDEKDTKKKKKKKLTETSTPIKHSKILSNVNLRQVTIPFLVFVNRENEAYQIADALLSNRCADAVSGKPCLVAAGQMYGSGKTEMGKNATKSIATYESSKNELIDKYGQDVVQEYIDAEYVLVDCLYLPEPSEHISCFELALAYLLYTSFYRFIEELKQEDKLTAKQFCQEGSLSSPREVLEHFLQKFPKKSFFVHWDEIGIIEAAEYESFQKWQPISADTKLEIRLIRYYDFLRMIVTTLAMPRVYTFCTSKSPAFAMLGLKFTSPCDIDFVILRGLDADPIYSTMDQTTINQDTSILNYLNIPKQYEKFFCQELHKRSGGLPRIVHKALEGIQITYCNLSGLCSTCPSLKTEADITKALDETAYEHITRIQGEEVFIKESILTSNLYDYYISLLMMSLLQIPIRTRDRIKIGNIVVPVLELVDRLDLFIEPTDNQDEFRINYAQYVSRHLLSQLKVLGKSDTRIPYIEPYLQAPEILRLGGEPLEYLTKMILTFSLTQSTTGKTWGQLYSFFQDVPLLNDTPFHIVAKVNYLPKIQMKCKTERKNAEEFFEKIQGHPLNIWRSMVSSQDWPLLFKHLFPVNTVGHPAPKSESGDILLHTESVIISFVNKLCTKDNPATWSKIQNEISLAEDMIAYKPVVLVFISTTLGKQVSDAIASGGLSYKYVTEGQWYDHPNCVLTDREYSNETLRRLNKDSKEKSVLNVPSHLHLLILGRGALEEFFGKPKLDALEAFTSQRIGVTSVHNSIVSRVPGMLWPAKESQPQQNPRHFPEMFRNGWQKRISLIWKESLLNLLQTCPV